MSENVTPPICRVLIGRNLIFCLWRHQHAVIRLENVRQLKMRQKAGFQIVT